MGLQSTVTIVRAGRCKAFLFVAVDRLEPNRRFALVLRCLAVAPGYRCDFAGRAKWGKYRRHRNADGAPAGVRAGGIARHPSTSLMLCLAAVAVLAAVARWELIVTRGAFSTSAVFGVGCGLLAMIDTVTLITRKLTL